MAPDGTGRVVLTDREQFSAAHPVWSPDGQRLGFVADSEVLYVMDADGQGLTRLAAGSSIWFGAYWSPDGSRLAFNAGDFFDADIYVVNADGSGLTLLADQAHGFSMPGWRP
jgi:TolB protein